MDDLDIDPGRAGSDPTYAELAEKYTALIVRYSRLHAACESILVEYGHQLNNSHVWPPQDITDIVTRLHAAFVEDE